MGRKLHKQSWRLYVEAEKNLPKTKNISFIMKNSENEECSALLWSFNF